MRENHCRHDLLVSDFIERDMENVPKGIYRRHLEVSEATFQALPQNHTAGEIHHYKPILNFSLPRKGFDGCLPCDLFATLRIMRKGG
jgi:hypothetical protein